MEIKKFEFNPFGENCYVLHSGSAAVVIDPGMMIEAERIEFADYMRDNSLTLSAVLLTHCHIDHVASARYLAQLWGVPVVAHEGDRPLAAALQAQAERFGFNRRYFTFQPLELDKTVADGETIAVGDEQLTVIHTPGHSPGGICYYDEAQGVAFVGDTLFAGSVGRCDLPGGDMPTLINSICGKLYRLPGETIVYCGHGPETTIAREIAGNPYTWRR